MEKIEGFSAVDVEEVEWSEFTYSWSIILTCVAPDKRFRAKNFGKYTYEDVSVTADNLSVLEKCGYVRRAS